MPVFELQYHSPERFSEFIVTSEATTSRQQTDGACALRPVKGMMEN